MIHDGILNPVVRTYACAGMRTYPCSSASTWHGCSIFWVGVETESAIQLAMHGRVRMHDRENVCQTVYSYT